LNLPLTLNKNGVYPSYAKRDCAQRAPVNQNKKPDTPHYWLTAAAGLLAFAVLLAPLAHAASETLAVVKGNKFLRCGIGENVPGFSEKVASGGYRGFNVDFCRAVAAAVLGDPDKVAYTPVNSAGRFPLLLSGRIELLSHTTTWNLAREAGIGLTFPGIYFYDGQGFMVPHASGVRHIEDLKDASICVEKFTTHVPQLNDVFRQRGLPYTPLIFEDMMATANAFFEGKCKAYTSDRSTLAAMRSRAPGGPERYDILPEIISREPLAPVVRRGDEQWATIVRWVLNVLVIAEDRGFTAANVRRTVESSTNPNVQRFVAEGKSVARALGLPEDWYLRAVEAGGNYGEIFERNLGAGSPLKIERGQNRLWTDGGLLYAPPLH
jgi:general L-amino acid transport system substrate-binding protein